MFIAGEIIPIDELERRRSRCRALLARLCPEAGGLLVFSRVTTYYFTGTLCNGIFWLPLEGEPLLLARKGIERARLESPDTAVTGFRSYGDLAKEAAERGCPLPRTVAVDKSVLPWNLAETLVKRLSEHAFVSGDVVIARSRSVKTPWELEKMRAAGLRHNEAFREVLPTLLRVGMNEREISLAVWDAYFRKGGAGPTRMAGFGEEVFLGHVCAGESGNYPSYYNGPLGLMGAHPAVPFMGYEGNVWQAGMPLSVDTGFTFEGYNTDKTQIYFAGSENDLPDTARRAQETCLAIERSAAEKLCPGAIPQELYQNALAMAEKAGFAEGFMGLGGNKVPFLGHGIGLAIDEWPVLASRFEEPLEPGMVLALEPKIGIAGFGMVGSENTYEVTERGGVCLTGSGEMIFRETRM